MSKRSALVRQLPCVCCDWEGQDQPNPTEEHHCNAFELAGKKRLGDDYSIALCGWHHRGVMPLDQPWDWNDTRIYGPSLARHKVKFRERYGSDEHLIKLTNEALEKL